MASIVTRADKSKEIRFFFPKGKRKTLWLGRVTKSTANTLKIRIEQLVEKRSSGASLGVELAEWARDLDADLHEKLVKFGLLEHRRTDTSYTVDEWVDYYIETKGANKAAGTLENWRQTKRTLTRYFGTKPIHEITEYDASAFETWLETQGGVGEKPLEHNTVRRRIGRSKQFFRAAVKAGAIRSNPFAELASMTDGNEERQRFIPQEWAYRILEQCPDVDWRTIIALSRFGGLRTPSETLGLKWADVDLPGGRMTIRDTKRKKRRGRGIRTCPIFAELEPYLQAAWDAAPDEGAVYVVHRYRGGDTNLRTQFERIICSAQLDPWPKPFQNMRASRETELLALYPIRDVVEWIGNSRPVAMKHYAMPLESSFERAKRQGAHTTFHTTPEQPRDAKSPQSKTAKGEKSPKTQEKGGL